MTRRIAEDVIRRPCDYATIDWVEGAVFAKGLSGNQAASVEVQARELV